MKLIEYKLAQQHCCILKMLYFIVYLHLMVYVFKRDQFLGLNRKEVIWHILLLRQKIIVFLYGIS